MHFWIHKYVVKIEVTTYCFVSVNIIIHTKVKVCVPSHMYFVYQFTQPSDTFSTEKFATFQCFRPSRVSAHIRSQMYAYMISKIKSTLVPTCVHACVTTYVQQMTLLVVYRAGQYFVLRTESI